MRRRTYWVSKTRVAALVSKRASPVLQRTTEKLKGSSTYLNSSLKAEALPPAEEDGRSKTEEGTW